MILVDNSALSFAFNVTNGIPILPFFDDEQDEELKHLTFYLTCLKDQKVNDIRENNSESFGLLKLKEDDDQHRTSKDMRCEPIEIEELPFNKNFILGTS